MKRILFSVALLVHCLVSIHASGQTVNSQVGGVVQDTSRALIPGATITLGNTATGVVTSQVSNESGAYSFPSVQPGTYRLTATLPGFKTSVVNELPVGTSTQVRWDFVMQVGELASQVEVSVSAQQLLTESSASVGEVLATQRVVGLPLVNGDILELVRIMPGLRQGLASDANSVFAGMPIGTINTVRDGLSVSDTRTNSGLFATTTINPDLVGEIRIILAPVDAEQGRGNGQIQIQTRSGTNRYTGSAVWNIRNSALNANTWNNNNNVDPLTGQWSPTPLDWRNAHQYTVSYGGPIVRNKTFFFVLWDHNLSNTRSLVTNTVLTDTARQGIFRYFTGWNSGNARTPIPDFPASATGGTYPVVDIAGNPVAPPFNPNGSPYSGGLRCYSVFGDVKADGTPFTAADCPGGTAIIGAAWDPLRPGMDSTGYIQKIIAAMPRANFWAPGGTTVDGLNLAQFRWLRGRKGATGGAAQAGTSPELINRKQINVKIDEHFTARHRLSVGWSYQQDDNAENVANWPGGLNGDSKRRPHVLTTNFTSTLASAIVNEARFGLTLNKNEVNPAWYSSDSQIREEARSLLLSGGTNPRTGITYPVAFSPGAGNFGFGNHIINATGSTFSGHSSPLYNFADTLSWTRGTHAFRMGAELRLTRSDGFSGDVLPEATGGAGGNTSALTGSIAALPGQLANTRTNAANMLYFLSGSVNTADMLYWIDSDEDVKNGIWHDYATAERRFRKQVSNEYAFFFKDDWKLTNRLTLNLGLRYEFFGSPYLRGGYTASIADQGYGLFGAGRTTAQPFDSWLSPGNLFLTGYGPNTSGIPALTCAAGVSQSPLLPVSTCNPDLLTRIEFVGPDSDKPDLSTIPNDRNNFGPAIGFAWQLPWFGEGKTSVRGGFQLTYGGSGRNAGAAENLLGNIPGNGSAASLLTSDFPELITNRALTLADLPVIVPVRPTSPALPGGQVPVYNRNTAFTAYDPNFATPYAQNFTLSVTRSLNRYLTLDVRYVGTMGKKRQGTLNVNLPDVYYNKELWDALEMTRRGEDAPLFDQMFAGLDLHGNVGNGYGAVGTSVNGVLQRGSAHLRRNAAFTNNIANGNFDAVAAALNTLSNVQSGLLSQAPGVSGRVLRNGCDRLAAGMTNIPTRCFPENYIVANPQLSTATYTSNLGSSNYHGLQTQLNLRPVQGISFQTTYSWTKTLGLVPQGYTDPLDRDADYTYQYLHVKHDLHSNGTFELPIGPNKLLLPNASGWVARLVERWQMSVIYNVFSGNPRTLIGAHMRYATGLQTLDQGQNRLNIVSPNFDNEMRGHAQWNGPNNDTGTYYGDKFILTRDPQCALTDNTDSMGFNLFANGSCTLNAVAARNPDGTAGEIMLMNPLPGGRGNMPLSLESPGKWRLDANLGKTFQISESKSLTVRFDATNLMNHPDLSDFQPQTGQSVNSTGVIFGRIPDKGGSLTGGLTRRIQGQLRFSF